MGDAFKVSQSKLKTWRRCRYAYHCRYVEKLKKRRKSRPLQFGSMVHEMIEAYANGDDPFERLDLIAATQGKMFREELEEYGNLIEDVRAIMTDYFDYYDERSLLYLRRKGRSSEHSFEVELIDGIILEGKIDAFAKTPNRLVWSVEHKTFSRMPNEDERWRNIQSATYHRVTQMLGWFNIDGIVWDYIRSKAPTMPRVLKDGSLGKRSIDSLPTVMMKFLEDAKLDPKKHKELLVSVRANRANYFKRIFTPTKEDVVDILWKDLQESALEARDLHGKVKARTIDQHCSWCDYEAICRAELTGGDMDFVKEKEYYVDEKNKSVPEVASDKRHRKLEEGSVVRPIRTKRNR